MHNRFNKLSSMVLFAASIMLSSAVCAANSFEKELNSIKDQWAELKYKTSGDAQEEGFEKLIVKTENLAMRFPGNAKGQVWLGTVLSSYAATKSGLSALSLVKRARIALETGIKMDAKSEGGFGMGVLGLLYAKVPKWPVAFGNRKTAGEYLDKAIVLSPNSKDINYYMAEYQHIMGNDSKAHQYLDAAEKADSFVGSKIALEGRLIEIEKLKQEIS